MTTQTLSVASLDGRRLVALALPVAVPIAMTAVFNAAREMSGPDRGYVIGFGAYWLACGGLATWLVGPARLRALFADRRPRLGRPALLGVALLAWPALGAVATRFIPEVGSATAGMLATIAGVALVNSFVEELFWRGAYIALWPKDLMFGWIWPALGFGLWHLAPQTIHPSSLGPVGYVVAATALGLSWGWVALRTGSLRWAWLSHVIADASGVRNALFFLGAF